MECPARDVGPHQGVNGQGPRADFPYFFQRVAGGAAAGAAGVEIDMVWQEQVHADHL
ncbi:hypothetical protein [Frankia sp. Cppng1_Ct_nod]|uniref:hypothetical protein n=1 Tax=Frankia sp. Cppng1_Ct_nod TaxID=2897162 RepID=UPI0013EFAF30|nr:hypothetical protein [Frankia sp. Cppng1_Ct_nod]